MAQGVSNLTDEEISDDVSISSSKLWLLSKFLRHEPVLVLYYFRPALIWCATSGDTETKTVFF